jgi:hypothetical protein
MVGNVFRFSIRLFRRREMEVHAGDSARINAAAFTGSRLRNREAIPCDVLAVEESRLQVKTRFPYRVFTMWVGAEWLEDAEHPE